MSSLPQCKTLMQLIEQACGAGARLHKACAIIGLASRTVQRWVEAGKSALYVGDRRAPEHRLHNRPPNTLSEAERQAALDMLNNEEFKDLPPSQIVPRLADKGLHVTSESTLYRQLCQVGQLAHRRLERAPQKRSKPRLGGHVAQSDLLLGHHLFAQLGARSVLLSVPVRGHLKPQGGGLAGL